MVSAATRIAKAAEGAVAIAASAAAHRVLPLTPPVPAWPICSSPQAAAIISNTAACRRASSAQYRRRHLVRRPWAGGQDSALPPDPGWRKRSFSPPEQRRDKRGFGGKKTFSPEAGNTSAGAARHIEALDRPGGNAPSP